MEPRTDQRAQPALDSGSGVGPSRPDNDTSLERLERALNRDEWVRAAAVVGGMLCFMMAWSADPANPYWSLMWVVLAVGAWMTINRVSLRALRVLPSVDAAIELEPASAQQQLDEVLALWPLQPAVRMLFYHRLAALRHRQQRYVETAAITTLLLTRRGGLQRALQRLAENGGSGLSGGRGIRGVRGIRGIRGVRGVRGVIPALASDGPGLDPLRTELLLLMVDSRLRCWRCTGRLHGVSRSTSVATDPARLVAEAGDSNPLRTGSGANR